MKGLEEGWALGLPKLKAYYTVLNGSNLTQSRISLTWTVVLCPLGHVALYRC